MPRLCGKHLRALTELIKLQFVTIQNVSIAMITAINKSINQIPWKYIRCHISVYRISKIYSLQAPVWHFSGPEISLPSPSWNKSKLIAVSVDQKWNSKKNKNSEGILSVKKVKKRWQRKLKWHIGTLKELFNQPTAVKKLKHEWGVGIYYNAVLH